MDITGEMIGGGVVGLGFITAVVRNEMNIKFMKERIGEKADSDVVEVEIKALHGKLDWIVDHLKNGRG